MRTAVVLVACLLALPLASAGTRDDPEITDAAGDYRLTGGQSDSQNLVRSVDLVAAWVEAVTDDHVELRVQAAQQMRGGNVAGNPTTQYDYDYHFEVDGSTYTAAATVVGPAPPTVTPRGVASEASIDPTSDSTLILIVPLESIGNPGPGSVISGMYVASRVYAGSGTMGTDRAPDADAGRDFLFPVEEGPAVTFIDQAAGAWEHRFEGNGTNATFQINWTAPANATFSLGMIGNGTVQVTVVDASNATLFTCACTMNQTEDLAGVNGTWNITLAYMGFNGTAVFSMDETKAHDDHMDHMDDHMDGQNETAEPASEDSPALPVAVVLVSLVILARRRSNL